MTLEEFLVELKASKDKYKWIIMDNQMIRARIKGGDIFSQFCPISAVANLKSKRTYYSVEYDTAGYFLGLDRQTQENIAMSADYKNTTRFELRKMLLDALGLKEIVG